MIRKISILTLAFVFFGATTGMPVTIHFCKMLDKTSANSCKMHQPKVIKHSCCEDDEQSGNPVKITSQNLPCCQDELVYNKVKDDFLSFNTEGTNVHFAAIAFVETVQQNYTFDLNPYSFYTDTSPPQNSNPIYLNISLLLI